MYSMLGYLDGLVQDCSNSIANALGLLQPSIKPSIFSFNKWGRRWSPHLCLQLPCMSAMIAIDFRHWVIYSYFLSWLWRPRPQAFTIEKSITALCHVLRLRLCRRLLRYIGSSCDIPCVICEYIHRKHVCDYNLKLHKTVINFPLYLCINASYENVKRFF